MATTTAVRHLTVTWHCLVLAGSHTTNVAIGGDPEMGGVTTEADIPAIISIAAWGHHRNADLVVVDAVAG